MRNITQNQGIIHKVTRIYCDNEDDRKDLFQEILIQLWKSYDKFREQSKFSTWMYRVAINTAITNFKKDAKNRRKSELGKEIYLLEDEVYDYEKEEHLNLLHECKSLADDRYSALLDDYLKLGRMLYRFIEAVEIEHQT